MKKKIFIVALFVLVSVLLWRTQAFKAPEIEVPPAAASVSWDADDLAEGLAGALRFATISNIDESRVDRQTFADFHAYLKQRFPNVFARIPHQAVKDETLLFRWQGSDNTQKPVLLLAHQDVVPVIPGTEAQWTYSPFAGTVADGYIWGRGAVDDKASVIGILEAVERLLKEGFVPPRTIYLAFGHDEEVGGTGAKAIAALLAERGERLAFLLDEGGVISKDLIPGVDKRVALLGPGEKGYVSLKLSVTGDGGHASMPPRNTAAGIVGRAVARLEDNPFPADLNPTIDFFRYLGDDQPFIQRLLFANSWLFSPVLKSILADMPTTNAGMRTTTAVTMMQGSVKDNVLPIEAWAVVNFRIMPGESIASVRDYVARVIDDERVQIENYGFGSEPSALAASDSAGFKVLSEVIKQIDPEVLVTPRLVVAATDARHFEGVAENSYRFAGVEITPRELKGIHGTDERVSVASYVQAVGIYYQLLIRSAEL